MSVSCVLFLSVTTQIPLQCQLPIYPHSLIFSHSSALCHPHSLPHPHCFHLHSLTHTLSPFTLPLHQNKLTIHASSLPTLYPHIVKVRYSLATLPHPHSLTQAFVTVNTPSPPRLPAHTLHVLNVLPTLRHLHSVTHTPSPILC